jgi:hypothetical protein
MNEEFLAVLAKDAARDARLPMGQLRLTADRVFRALAPVALCVALGSLIAAGVMFR